MPLWATEWLLKDFGQLYGLHLGAFFHKRQIYTPVSLVTFEGKLQHHPLNNTC
jgi:hypothetical protein